MILSDAIVLLCVALVIVLFWQGRRQAEYARRYAQQYCKQNQLQFLDIAWKRGRIAKIGRHIGWLSDYEFAFSSDGESRYEGNISLINLRLRDVSTPPYRLPSVD